jgi:2,3-bisphosphoglycerate-independent phosphoglycerate mutase
VGDIENEAKRLGVGKVVSVIGRYWALDREEHWDRVEKAFRLIVDGKGQDVPAE